MKTLDQWIDFNNYYCLQSYSKIAGQENSSDHVPNTAAWMQFLSQFGIQGYNAYDFDRDGDVDTQDMLRALAGMGTKPTIDPEALPLEQIMHDTTFGEGNHFWTGMEGATFNGEQIDTVILKNTIADEISYDVEKNPNSFQLEILCGTSVYKYSFVKKIYQPNA